MGYFQFKAAVINIFMLSTEQITVCNVEGFNHKDKPK